MRNSRGAAHAGARPSHCRTTRVRPPPPPPLQVIPYLTVYAVLPSSLVFLVLYSFASQRLTRGRLFNAIILIFMAFFGLFAFVLYPFHHVLHPHALADRMAEVSERPPASRSGLLARPHARAHACSLGCRTVCGAHVPRAPRRCCRTAWRAWWAW